MYGSFYKVVFIISAIIVGGVWAFDSFIDDSVFATRYDKQGGVINDSLAKEIHDAINQYRSLNGAKGLAYDIRLASVAQQHSDNMADQNIVAHVLNNQNHAERFRANGYHCNNSGGENLLQYSGHLTVQEIVQTWIDSPDHKKTMVAKFWKNSGVGVSKNSEFVFITQNFC